jgi:hypothetical protein
MVDRKEACALGIVLPEIEHVQTFEQICNGGPEEFYAAHRIMRRSPLLDQMTIKWGKVSKMRFWSQRGLGRCGVTAYDLFKGSVATGGSGAKCQSRAVSVRMKARCDAESGHTSGRIRFQDESVSPSREELSCY